MEVRQSIKLLILIFLLFFYYFRYKLLKSKALENEDDSTSSDSYTEKVPSIIIIEKFNKINSLIKELKEKCKIFSYNSIIYVI